MKKIVMFLCAATFICTSFAQSPDKHGLEASIGKPVDNQAIDKVVGAESHPGIQYSAFEKDDCLFSVAIYSNWQKSRLAVCVLIRHTKDAKIMTDFMVMDSDEFRRQYPDADLSTGLDEQYKEVDGKQVQDNLVVSIYDYNETEVGGGNPEYYTRILKAWTIDKERLKFIEVPTEGLTHYNVGYDA